MDITINTNLVDNIIAVIDAVIEREIFTEIFPTHREAREKMITEMKEYGAEIPNECSEKEYECDNEFGFSEWSAYLNDGNNHDNYDWLIVAL